MYYIVIKHVHNTGAYQDQVWIIEAENNEQADLFTMKEEREANQGLDEDHVDIYVHKGPFKTKQEAQIIMREDFHSNQIHYR